MKRTSKRWVSGGTRALRAGHCGWGWVTEGRAVSEPVTAGSSLSRPSGAEQCGNRGAAADQVAPEAASGGHPGERTLEHSHSHMHALVSAHAHVSMPTYPQSTHSQILTHARTPDPSLVTGEARFPPHRASAPAPQEWGRTEFPRDAPHSSRPPGLRFQKRAKGVGEKRTAMD